MDSTARNERSQLHGGHGRQLRAGRMPTALQRGHCGALPRQRGSSQRISGQSPPVPPTSTIGLHNFHR